MSAFVKFAACGVLLVSLLGAPLASNAAPTAPGKLTDRARRATTGATADLLVQAPGYPDLSPARAIADKTARTRFVFNALTRHAGRAQSGLLRDLRARGLRATSLWISNQVLVQDAAHDDALWLAQRADVRQVDVDATFQGVQTVREHTIWSATSRRPVSAANGVEWGVTAVNAPLAWAMGVTGTGIVVADLDTGVMWDHPALKTAYRGWDGVTVTHNYNWFDAAGPSVGTPRPDAFDDNGHGTHTVGTILGDDGAGNQVGVAPGARWIGCRNMLFNVGSVARYTACFQFALAPTDVNGANPDPSKAADITSNSWGCFPPDLEVGCGDPMALITVTQTLRDAGIFVIASAGNSGSSCATIATAPGMLDQAFTVGASTAGNGIASFSSRGPSTLSGRVKPDLVAPGSGVRSATFDGLYGLKSGTSMAAPHVSGVTALLLSDAPELRGQVSEVEAILRRTAQPLTSAENCSATPGSARPNNTFGHGLIDAKAAIDEARRLRAIPVVQTPQFLPNTSEPFTVTFSLQNGYETLSMTRRLISFTLPVSTVMLSASPGLTQSGALLRWDLEPVAPGAMLTRALVLQRDPNAPAVTHTLALPLVAR